MLGRVLVMDSNFVTRKNTIASLMRAGYEVSVADNPVVVANVADQESPDLVILGDSMVNPLGLAFVGRLFSSAATAKVPVLVIANTPQKQVAAEQSGPRLVLPGPVTGPDLLGAVAVHIVAPGALPQAPASLLNDAERLAAVDALRPNSSAQAGLDRFTQLASKMLQVPVSTITLIDKDRQVYASQVGIGEPWASVGYKPLEYSYCQYAVTSRQPLRIDDAAQHPLVQQSPAISEQGAVAYVGIPLIMDDDQAVGTLCVLDSRPRHWTDHEVGILNDLAGILTAQLNSTRRNPGRHTEA